MSRELPSWLEAQLIVVHNSISVGVFPSSKPWMPRHKDRRFLAAATGPIDPHDTPVGGSPLPSLRDSATHSIQEHDFAIIAGEAEGYRSIELTAGGAGWTAIVAVDAWVAVGPRISAPERIQVGPHALEFPLLGLDPQEAPTTDQESVAVVEFRFKAPE